MERLSSLQVRLADLLRSRGEYEVTGKRHLVTFIDHLIADTQAAIDALDRQSRDPKK